MNIEQTKHSGLVQMYFYGIFFNFLIACIPQIIYALLLSICTCRVRITSIEGQVRRTNEPK